jgi:hypothetical protein
MASPARESFLQRLEALSRALMEPAMRHVAPVAAPNDPGRLLRNGLAVTGFNLLEDFIKLRTKELLGHISATPLTFPQLPDKLRRAVTENAVEGLIYQTRLVRSSARASATSTQAGVAAASAAAETLIANSAADLASITGHPFTLSPLAFAQSGANVDSAEVANICKSLGVEGGWQAVEDLTTRLGATLPKPPASIFDDAMHLRHTAAHDATHDTPLNDLSTFVSQAMAIGCAFDMLTTRASYQLRTGDLSPLPITGNDPGFVSVDRHPALDYPARFSAAQVAAVATGDAVVTRSGGQIFAWYLTDLEAGRP